MTHTFAQLSGRGEASPALLENQKTCPDFRKKGPDCVHLSVKFSIQNIVLRLSRRKLIYYSFWKTLHPKCLIVFWMCLCLDNCSVICTVTLCYVLHQTHSEFWHIQHSVFSGICRHIPSYSALLRHVNAYRDIIKAYSGLFRHIQHPV